MKSDKSMMESKLSALQLETDKTTKELSRLRFHLVEAEDNHTHESITSESKLKDLEAEVSNLNREKEELLSVMSSERASIVRAEEMIQTSKLDKLEFQEDLSRLEEEKRELERSLKNLQSVLEQFQFSKDEEITSALDSTQEKIQELESKLLEWKTLHDERELEMEVIRGNEKKMNSLQGELDEKNTVIGKLRHDGT